MAADYKTMTERQGPRVLGSKGSEGPYKKVQGSFALLVLALVVFAFADGPSGRQRTLGPSRIVSLVPAVTEMLFAIGAGKDVVGVSSFDTYPPEVRNIPKVGALIDPDFERILSLKADLVVVYGTQTDLSTRLARAGVPMFQYEHAGLADITTTIRALGVRVGRAGDAEALASRIEREIALVRKNVSAMKRPRAVVIFGREPGALRNIYASAGVGFIHDMLEAAGGEDIFADVKRQNIQATAEMLLARAPEVIIEIHAGAAWNPERIARERETWRALPSLPAVKTGRVHILVDDRLFIPGPRAAEAVRLLAETLLASGRGRQTSPSSIETVVLRQSRSVLPLSLQR